jgi:hypothetical protein
MLHFVHEMHGPIGLILCPIRLADNVATVKVIVKMRRKIQHITFVRIKRYFRVVLP